MSQMTNEPRSKESASLLIRGAIWIAIGALIAAALVCVVWVLVGDQNGIIGRAFLTILLLAAFAGIAIVEAGLAPKRPDWLALASMITWIIVLLVGAVKIWLPTQPGEYAAGMSRFFLLLVVVGILQLALLHVRPFTTVIYYATIGVLVLLVVLLVIYLTLPDTFDYPDLYWRIVVALAILAAVGTTLIPLLNALFAPKRQPQAPVYAPQSFAPAASGVPAIAAPAAQQQWPTYADGVTPLPVMPDGGPDWNAYYTGYPTYQPAPSFPVAAAPAQAPSFDAPVASPVPQAPQVADAPTVPAAPEVPQAPAQNGATPGSFPPPPPAAP